jgi:hypothetical protein
MRDGEEILIRAEKTSFAARTLEVSLDTADNVIEGALGAHFAPRHLRLFGPFTTENI